MSDAITGSNTTTVTNQPICATGASGFIAAHIVKQLLQQGYKVRGTVRSTQNLAKYDYLTQLPGASTNLELVEAELTQPGSYDKAVAGCEYVMHTASPYIIDVKDPQKDLVDPAVEGTVNVLRACAKTDTVKRVILTSSMAAISDEPEDDHVFTERDWNHKSDLKRNPYYYSKRLAEESGWDFMKNQRPDFDLVVINPFMVIGPSLGPGLNTSNQMFKDIVEGKYPGILQLNWGFVDVRDVAKAHILAMENPKAKGRYLCAASAKTMSELVELLRKNGYEQYKLPKMNMANGFGTGLMKLASYTQPKGVGSYLRSHLGKTMRFENAKIKRELGMQFKPVEESILDATEDLKKWNHLAA